MKKLLVIFILISQYALVAQTKIAVGDYKYEAKLTDGNALTHEVTLHPNGTYAYTYYRFIEAGIPQKEHKSDGGTWKITNKLISFTSNNKNQSKEETIDLSHSKARLDYKSPRNTSSENSPTTIQFHESDIPWIKSYTLTKA
ncbi:hypothetical protein BN863_7940 [Formosa agariphila KMM 3901]|uniref:Uncharacterized protein n=1 Tax=Formosa agariphila (strain DSM 15362 / KCTC 12365 / LMG 23005 / KMM 3901 / M-2Alg 35-1) TaxID=1347342 RepID=T2KJA3_FORAG|nr:hypothetical protein [Formosa agariphila]CDF78506.1 hypothetical protein BN863_7940 [Formosa agariphila KMM 3901]